MGDGRLTKATPRSLRCVPIRSNAQDAAVRTRRYAVAYSLTLLFAAAGPAVLIVLGLHGRSWRAETEPFFSLVAQVIPVLLLAFAIEENVLRRSPQAKPVKTHSGCSSSWPS